MKINVKLINQFKKYGEGKLGKDNQIKINNDKYLIRDLINYLGIPENKRKIILVNGRSVDFNYRLKNGDKVVVYNLIAGG